MKKIYFYCSVIVVLVAIFYAGDYVKSKYRINKPKKRVTVFKKYNSNYIETNEFEITTKGGKTAYIKLK